VTTKGRSGSRGGSERGTSLEVLSGSDRQTATGFYWYLTLLACVGGFLFGYDTAFIGSVLDFVPYDLGDLATGYLVAGASLGAAVGALAAGPLTDRFGRKSLLIAERPLPPGRPWVHDWLRSQPGGAGSRPWRSVPNGWA